MLDLSTNIPNTFPCGNNSFFVTIKTSDYKKGYLPKKLSCKLEGFVKGEGFPCSKMVKMNKIDNFWLITIDDQYRDQTFCFTTEHPTRVIFYSCD